MPPASRILGNKGGVFLAGVSDAILSNMSLLL